MDALTQLPGNLPTGATLESLLTAEQFATWRGISQRETMEKIRAGTIPAVRDSRTPRVHVRTYLASLGKEFRRAMV
jgi:hypothetical protein